MQVWKLELKRMRELHRLARVIQRSYRSWHGSYGVKSLVHAQIIIAAYYRRYRARKEYLSKKWACIRIAAYFRGWKVMHLVIIYIQYRLCTIQAIIFIGSETISRGV